MDQLGGGRNIRLWLTSKMNIANTKVFGLTNRFQLYGLPLHTEQAEYILIDQKYPVFTPKPLFTQKQALEDVDQILSSSDYEIIKKQDKVVLLKKKPTKQNPLNN